MNRREFLQKGSRLAAGAAIAAGARASGGAEAGKPRIKVGQIGTAHAHAAGKIATLRGLPEHYDVVGVVEPDHARRAMAAKHPKYKDVPWLTEEQLLNFPGLQAVAVETAVRDLVPTAMRCVSAGLHMHLDKPGGESLAAFASLLEQAQARGVVVQMGYMLRYNPAFQLCLRAVREGWLGNVFEVHGVMSKQVDDASRKELAEFPGGAMFELGCHLIDVLVAVLGKPQRVVPFSRHTHPESDRLADNQIAVFEYPQATATIRSAVIEPYGNERRQFVVCGEAGTIAIAPIEPPKVRLALKKPHDSYRTGVQDVSFPERGGRYDGDFLDLAKVIRREKPFDWTAAHDLAVHDTVLRASGMGPEP